MNGQSDVLQLVIPGKAHSLYSIEEEEENSNLSLKAMLEEFKKANPVASAFKIKDTMGTNKEIKMGGLSTDSFLEGKSQLFISISRT